MLCFKDRTYCIAQCANKECDRQITENVLKEAKAIGLPLSQCDFSINCKEYKPKITKIKE